MQVVRRRREVALLGLRARAPLVIRAVALVAAVGVVGFVAYSIRHSRGADREFKLRSGKAELSTNVVRRVENYERIVSDGERVSMLVRAAVATSFEDGHHELSQVHIEHFRKGQERPEKIDAREGIYFNETEQVHFTGAVQVETSDQLRVGSESLNYSVKEERAESPVALTFSRENVSGRAGAGTLDGKRKHLELSGGVEITVAPAAADAKSQAGSPRGKPVTIRSQKADFDQASLNLVFAGGASAEQERDVMSGDTLSGFLNAQHRLQRIETRGNSFLRSGQAGKAAEVNAVNMNFVFDERQQLQSAVAWQDVRAHTLDADSEAMLTTPDKVEVSFAAQGEESVVKEMRAGGRPVLTLSAPRSQAQNPKSASGSRPTRSTFSGARRAATSNAPKPSATPSCTSSRCSPRRPPTASSSTPRASTATSTRPATSHARRARPAAQRPS
jgi:LPS export ABC transporter protein LptC